MRPWHEKARVLLSLLDRQYDLGEDDWYGEYDCFIARYGQDDEKLGVLCLEEEPSTDRINNFIRFIKTREGRFHKLVIAVKGRGAKNIASYQGLVLERRYESELLDALLSLSEYKRYVSNYFDRRKLENSELSLSDMYVPLGGHMMGVEKGKLLKTEALASVEAYILDWAKGNRSNPNEHLAILGHYGQGKTVLMHKLVLEMLRNPEEYPRIPILIELRGLSPRNDDEFGILGQWAKRYRAPAEALWELHQAGKLLIILDGFDEMDLVGDTELLFNHFSQLWRLARTPASQIIIAGRPNLFANDEERRMALGIREARTYLPYAQAIELGSLTESQIERVLRNTKAQTQNGILNALQASSTDSSFSELISRPSTLFQLSAIWDGELARYKDRLNSAVVIGGFLKKTYERQEHKEATVLTSFERDYFMMGIALGMTFRNEYTNQIKHKELERLVTNLWENYPEKLPPYQDALEGGTAKESLRKRLRDNTQVLDTILKDVRVGGVLVSDPSGRDVFKFAHKSYLEYLVSAFFTGYVLQNEHDSSFLMKVNAIAKSTGFSPAKFRSSPDVEQFTAELIAAQIELSDRQGNPLPIAGNEKQYSNRLFYMFILKPYPILGRLFPQLTGWLSFHPDQKFFVFIGLIASLSFAGFFLTDKDTLKLACIGLNALMCFWQAGIVLSYRWKKERLKTFLPALYITHSKLYAAVCQLLKVPERKFSDDYKTLLFVNKESRHYQEAVIALLSYCMFLSGVITVLIIVAEAGILAGIIAGGLAVAAIGAVALSIETLFSLAIPESEVLAGGITGIMAGVLAFAITIPFSNEGAYLRIISFTITLITSGIVFTIFCMLGIRKTFKKAIQGLKQTSFGQG